MIGVEQLIEDIDKLCSLKGDQESRYFKVLRMIALDNADINSQKKFDNRKDFNILYVNFINEDHQMSRLLFDSSRHNDIHANNFQPKRNHKLVEHLQLLSF